MANSKRGSRKYLYEDRETAPKEPRKEPEKAREAAVNTFENDGSFFEMFKKQMEEKQKDSEQGSSKPKIKPRTTKAVSPEQKAVVASLETELPCYSTQTMVYKDGEGEGTKKTHYQVTYPPLIAPNRPVIPVPIDNSALPVAPSVILATICLWG